MLRASFASKPASKTLLRFSFGANFGWRVRCSVWTGLRSGIGTGSITSSCSLFSASAQFCSRNVKCECFNLHKSSRSTEKRGSFLSYRRVHLRAFPNSSPKSWSNAIRSSMDTMSVLFHIGSGLGALEP